MFVYLDIKSLYPHLKVNRNVLICKICIARRLVVDIFPWCNANFVPFPSRTLVACQMWNGRINFTFFVISPKLQRIWSGNFGFATKKIWAFIWYQKMYYFRWALGDENMIGIRSFKGDCTPNQKLACFELYLKITNTFFEK